MGTPSELADATGNLAWHNTSTLWGPRTAPSGWPDGATS
ncbi:hypothetical protein [Amycolatopsis pigmentata]|uniref:Uncharacterized protein n=1 Tax=Amycolatopsis pigmentata TaxID=450801 RepID=A0ABW5G082_9PSEU